MSSSEPSSQNSYPYDVFLSHNRAQKDWTRDLARKLRDEGFEVWFDEWCLLPAENWIKGLVRGVKESRKIVLVTSPEFLDAEWPMFETYIAILKDPVARQARILPLTHTACDLPDELDFRQKLDFSETHDDPRRYEFRSAQLMAYLDPSRERPTDFKSFCDSREDFSPDDLPPVGALPRGSLMPFSHNPNFVGREEELKSLCRKFETGDSVALGQTAAATGLGGIGKTQLAVEFVYRYGRRFHGGVFWLDMSDPDGIPEQISRCGGAAGMALPGFDSLPLSDQVAAVMKEWHSQRRGLVVFDNVEQLDVVGQWRPKYGQTRVLITSRIDSHDPQWGGQGIETISVDTLPRDRSMELLLKGRQDVLDDTDEMRAANDICDLLGDLPLAVHLAGSYLSYLRHAVSVREYLNELSSRPVLTNPALVSGVRDSSPTDHIQNVAATFDMSYARLDQEEETDALAARLFHLTSHFAPTPIPRQLLIRALKMDKDEADDRGKVAFAVNRLCELGLAQTGEDGRIVVHRLLREFARLHPADGQEVQEAAVDAANAIYGFANDVNESGLPAPLREAVEHLRYAAGEAESRESEQAGSLYNELGYHLWQIADFGGAKEHYERAIKIGESVYGKDHPNVASIVNNLGLVLKELGDLEGAKEHYERALEIDEEAYGKDHPQVAIYVNNLGDVLQDLGDLAGAKEHYERALEIDESVYGKDHPNVAIDVNNLGSVLKALGDLAGAKEHFERALEIDEEAYGKDHPDVAIRVNNLGSVLKALGDLAGAKEHLERALEINESVYGKDHPNVAIRVNNLAGVFYALGDLAGAKEHYERALEIGESVYGKDHPQVAIYVNNLGMALQDLGDLARAKEHYERALGIFERRLGADHPSTRTARRNLQILLDSGAT